MTFEEIIYKTAKEIVPDNIALLMVAQSKHETGNYTSPVFKANKNCFGYKYFPGSKYQLKKGKLSPEGNSYAAYATIEDSVKEVAHWLTRHVKMQTIVSPMTYATALKQAGYFGDSIVNYTNGLQLFYKDSIA